MIGFDNIILASDMDPVGHVVVKDAFTIWGFTVTNHMFMIGLATVLLIGILPLAVRGKKLVRSGFGNLIEVVCVFIREEVARPFLGDSTDKHIGFIWTLFYFILTLNLLGMVPLARLIHATTGIESEFGGAATANIYVTGALAMIAFISIHVSGIREQGVWGYIKNFAPKVPWPMIPFIYLMEFIGALVKPFALAIRLFANILAGHILLATIGGLIFMFKSYAIGIAIIGIEIPMSFLEIFVAFLQAYIFTFLTTIFIGFAVHPDH